MNNKSDLRRARLVEQSLDLLCTANTEGYFTWVNPRFTEVLGWSANELRSRPYLEFVHPADLEATRAVDLEGDAIIGFENRYRTGAGEYIWLEWNARFDSTLGEVVAVAREVTSARLQRLMFQHSLDLFCIASLDGYFEEVSPSWQRALGYSPEELRGRAFWEFVHPDDVGRTIRAVQQMQSEQRTLLGFENRYRHRDGHHVVVEWNAAIDTRLEELVASGRDVTAQRRIADALAEAKERAEVASEAKTRFVANVSHELRTPLTSILGFAQVLRDGEEDDERRELLARIHGAGTHLLSLINDVLDLAKIERDRTDVELVEVDVEELLREVIDTLVPRAQVPVGLEVRGTAQTLGHWRTLRQIFVNLIGNAVKFTEEGEVNVIVNGDNGALVVEVRDTGPGIAPEHHEAIFEEFRQANETPGRAHPGTGLGLAIARRLARRMGGSISLRSAPGEGSTFVVELSGRDRGPRHDAS